MSVTRCAVEPALTKTTQAANAARMGTKGTSPSRGESATKTEARKCRTKTVASVARAWARSVSGAWSRVAPGIQEAFINKGVTATAVRPATATTHWNVRTISGRERGRRAKYTSAPVKRMV
ncbi:MAG: hypothetical protein IPJ41_06545 [Phycisphaerales bacterium]|nr:hypothetical protein [Phycisphaerales bacterium]